MEGVGVLTVCLLQETGHQGHGYFCEISCAKEMLFKPLRLAASAVQKNVTETEVYKTLSVSRPSMIGVCAADGCNELIVFMTKNGCVCPSCYQARFNKKQNANRPSRARVGYSVRNKTEAPVEMHGSRARQTHSSVTTMSNTGHENNLADMRPCTSRSDCGLLIFPCDNAVRTDLVEVKICKEIMEDPTKDEPVRRVERGLYWNGTQPIPEGTWVACFGPVRCNDRGMQDDLGYAVQVFRGSAQGDGDWSRKMEMVTPIQGWQGKFDGPYVNHTCCIHHVNAEFVPTEDYGEEEGAPITTVNVRTIKKVQRQLTVTHAPYVITENPEILVHYGPDYRRIVGVCRCCACRKARPECRKASSEK